MDYIKKALKRGALGVPAGVFINQTIFVIIALTNRGSLALNEGQMILQYSFSILVGFVYAASSIIYEVEEWSLLKQTFLHFIITTAVYFIAAAASDWLPKDIKSIILFIVLFLVIYIIIWLSITFYWTKKIKDVNDRLSSQNK